MAAKSPFEKGGNREICFGTPWENPPSPPFTKGGNTIYGYALRPPSDLVQNSGDRNLLSGGPRLEVVHTPSAGPRGVSRWSFLLGIATAVFSVVPQVVSRQKSVCCTVLVGMGV